MENQEKLLQAEIYKANQIIHKLQAQVGSLTGQIAFLETEKEILQQIIKNQEQEKKKEPEETKESEETKEE